MNFSDTCPRCCSGFHCGANDVQPCACTRITLSAELQATLRERYSGCLCLRCLTELSMQAGAVINERPQA